MTFLLRLVLAAIFTTNAFAAANTFEGKITVSLQSGNGGERTIDYAFKQGDVRMEPRGAAAEAPTVIMNWSKQELVMLIPQQKRYMVMPLKGTAPSASANGSEPKVERMLKTVNILGYPCEHFIAKDKGQVTELWLTDKLGSFVAGNPSSAVVGSKATPSTWQRVLESKTNAFPLRIITRDAKGREIFRLETRQIDLKPVPAALFVPPEGYEKFSMPTVGPAPDAPVKR